MRLVVLPLLAVLVATAQQPVQSPVDQRIAAARQQAEAKHNSFQSYLELAAAFCRKARDNADLTVYAQAQSAIDHALQLSPANREGRELAVEVMLGRHEFAAALKLATELNRAVPDDIVGWGLLVDANVALGNYDAAEHDAQLILNLRRGSALGFEKAAGLRELFGDLEGAVEFYGEAFMRTSQSDSDQRAWLLTRKANLELAQGNAKQAASDLAEAQNLFPDSQLVLAGLAEVKMAEGDFAAAAALLEKRYRAVANAANLYDWAEVLEKSGRNEQAATEFKKFEEQGRGESAQSFNANLKLIYFYADRAANPAEALAIATKEAALRQDSATLDAYAWALFRNGKYAEAKTEMDKALKVGVRYPLYLSHAQQISAKLHDVPSGASR